MRKKPGLTSILSNLLIAYINRLTDLIHLAGLEAKLAVKTLVNIIILIFIMIIFLISTWLCFLFLVFSYLISLHLSWVFSAFILTLLNIILFAVVCLFILKIKKNLFFPATRKQLKNDNVAEGLIE